MTQKVTVKRSIWIQASIEKVWDALTNEEDLLRWYTWECHIDFREGGKGFYNHGWGAYSSGIFEDIVPYKSFVLRTGEHERTITTLTPENDGVTVSIEYEMPSIENMSMIRENMAFGTDQFMANLKSVLEKENDIRPTFWKSWIGISHTSSINTGLNSKGSVVLQVGAGTPASDAGLKAGDLIIKANGCEIESYEQLERNITLSEVNEPLTLTVVRDNNIFDVTCKTTNYPNEYKRKVQVS